MSANFIRSGNLPSVRDLLNIIVRGWAMDVCNCLSMLLDMSSCLLLFLFGNLFIKIIISLTEVGC